MSHRPQLLDLFAGAQGCGVGYARVGYAVTAVDLEEHPRHPEVAEFILADALEVLADAAFLAKFDVVHASPPCQAYTTMSNRWRGTGGKADSHPDLIAPVRRALQAWGGTYVIENVPGARRQLIDPLTLRGGHFGLRVDRPRLFESNAALSAPPFRRVLDPIGVYGKRHDGRRLFTRIDGSEQRAARTLEEARSAMGIHWMSWDDLREAVPPTYTEHVGWQLRHGGSPCTLILHTTGGTCPRCGERVLAPEWNRRAAPGCYWCGHPDEIPCSSRCGCIQADGQLTLHHAMTEERT